MWRRLFPNLAKLEPAKLMGLAMTVVYIVLGIAANVQHFFIEQGWIRVVDHAG
jgi:hypothetical protein